MILTSVNGIAKEVTNGNFKKVLYGDANGIARLVYPPTPRTSIGQIIVGICATQNSSQTPPNRVGYYILCKRYYQLLSAAPFIKWSNKYHAVPITEVTTFNTSIVVSFLWEFNNRAAINVSISMMLIQTGIIVKQPPVLSFTDDVLTCGTGGYSYNNSSPNNQITFLQAIKNINMPYTDDFPESSLKHWFGFNIQKK
jgi:hypothetical protein